jgi:hypothetical protein
MLPGLGIEFLDDFDERLDFLIEEAEQAAAKGAARALAKAAQTGNLGNGRLPFWLLDEAQPAIDEMREQMLAAYDTARERHPHLEPDLREHLDARVSKVFDNLTTTLKLPQFRNARGMFAGVQDEIAQRRTRHERLVSHHISGFKVRKTHNAGDQNSITMHNSSAVIQQGGVGNLQSVTVTIDWRGVGEVAARLNEALSAVTVSEAVRDALSPDLDSIRAQLRKPSPSVVVAQEAARSLRNMAEGAFAGALVSAPHVIPIVHQLTKALGLG